MGDDSSSGVIFGVENFAMVARSHDRGGGRGRSRGRDSEGECGCEDHSAHCDRNNIHLISVGIRSVNLSGLTLLTLRTSTSTSAATSSTVVSTLQISQSDYKRFLGL